MVSSRTRYRRPTSWAGGAVRGADRDGWAWVSRSSRRSPISYLRCRRRKPISPVPRRAPRGGGLRRRGAAAGTCAAGSRPDPAALKRWLPALDKRAPSRGRERTLLTAIRPVPRRLCSPMRCSQLTRARFADTGHSLDFITRRLTCLDLIGWSTRPGSAGTVVGQLVTARGPRNRPPGATH